jgi:glycosyltransferase involved in cell wall biosynthesis
MRQLTLLSARLRRLPLVTRSDANPESLEREPCARRLIRRLALQAHFPRRTRVWAIGAANAAYWAGYVHRRNIMLIPYEVPRLPGQPARQPSSRHSDPAALRIMSVGRLSPEKEPLLLIEAFRGLVGPTYAGWRLNFVGVGPLGVEMAQAAAGDDRIVIHGACDYDVLDQHYAATDVVVLPSSYEPWGLVVNEALGFGAWAVVSDRVGARELLTDPDIGMVFRSGDVDDLRRALASAVHHLERRPRSPATDTAALMLAELRSLGAV